MSKKEQKVTITKNGLDVKIVAQDFSPEELLDLFAQSLNEIAKCNDKLEPEEDYDEEKSRCFKLYKDALETTSGILEEEGVEDDTMADSIAKVLSILGHDDQIRDDLARLLAGWVSTERTTDTPKKKTKKK